MNELEIKRVPFMGTELMAARDADGTIWADVRWMCEGIGLSEGQTKNERLKIQKDKVLTKGGRNFVLNESGYGNREAVEYIQRWRPSNNMSMLIQQTNRQTHIYN